MPIDFGQIELDGDLIRYTEIAYPEWSIRITDICVIGEATNQNGPAADYFLCFCTGPQMWYEASFYADGRDPFLAALGARLGASLQLELLASTDFASRILWPMELVGKPMFKFEDVPPRTLIGRLLARLIGPMQNEQTYSEHVLEKLSR